MLLLGSCMISQLSVAKDIYISPSNTSGIHKAKAGDTVWLKGGIYKEPIIVDKLMGTADKPIIISAMPGEEVIFDGTDQLDGKWIQVTKDSKEGKQIQPAQWERIEGKVYSLKVEAPVFALIYKGKLMTDARWPNARWDDPWRLDRYMVLRRAGVKSAKGKIEDALPTKNALEESEKWIHYDRSQLKHRDEMLGDLDISFTGGVVVLSHTWGSWATRITNHETGSNFFEYDTEFKGSGDIQKEATGFLNNRIGWKRGAKKFSRSSHSGIHFFFMGLPALDTKEEWWYDQASKTIYFISPDGKKPTKGSISGKRRDYQLTIKNSEYVTVKGFQFHGGATLLEHCSNSKLEDCSFEFAAMHKCNIGDFDMPVTTTIKNKRMRKNGEKLYGNSLVNCQFTYQDGNAFEGRSTGITIDNVLIYRTQQTTLGLDSRSMSIDRPLLVRRVTIDDVGASVGIKGGGIESVYELNNITRFGGLQYDGASLQMGGTIPVIYRYNWSHDHPKRSYRFDAGSYPDFANAYGEMSYNVAWNTPGGFALKGDDHLLHNNLIIGDGGFELFNMKRWASKNERTLVANNIVPKMSAGDYDWKKPVAKKSKEKDELKKTNTYWLKETVAPEGHVTSVGGKQKAFDDGHKRGRTPSPLLAIRKNNFLEKAETVLRDPANCDFRLKDNSDLIDGGYKITNKDVKWKKVPITGAETWKGKSADIGPYEYNPNYYWIPGYKHPHASTPVPLDGTLTAKSDCDLMWLGGYKAEEHHVYVGNTMSEVSKATKVDKAFKKTFKGENNIYSFDKNLPTGKTVFWRVDAVKDGKVIKGKVWKLTVGKESVSQ